MSADPGEALARGAEALGVALEEPAVAALLDYLALLERWGRRHNLTTVREPRAAVSRHVLDSLAVVPYVSGHRLLDVGSGAGLPGLPLAVAREWQEVVLLDSHAKRVAFLRHVTGRLALTRVTAVQQRCERYRPARRFDTVTARAVAPLPRLFADAAHLVAPGGRLLALKGPKAAEELESLAAPGWGRRLEALAVPGVAAERRLVILEAPGAPPEPVPGPVEGR